MILSLILQLFINCQSKKEVFKLVYGSARLRSQVSFSKHIILFQRILQKYVNFRFINRDDRVKEPRALRSDQAEIF